MTTDSSVERASKIFLNIRGNRNGNELQEVVTNRAINDITQETVLTDEPNLEIPEKFSHISRRIGINEISVSNCISKTDIGELLNAETRDFRNIRDVLVIKLKFIDTIRELNSSELQNLGITCFKISIIIVIDSLASDKFEIYWKLKDSQNFLSFKLNKVLEQDESQTLNQFIITFLIDSLKKNNLGLNTRLSTFLEHQTVELDLLADTRDFNLLFLASESGNVEIVKILMKFGLKTKSLDKGENAQSLAYKNNHWDVLFAFSQANLTFLTPFDIETCDGQFREFCKITKKLHELIIANESSKVTDILDKHKNLRYFYNFDNHSAVKVALLNKAFDTFDVLLSRKLHFGPHEDPVECYEYLSYDDKRTVRNIQNKYSQAIVEKHIHRLVENSTACFDETEAEDKKMYVERAFKLLSENLVVKILLKIVAASKNFKIYFDFNRDAINCVDPTANQHTQGVFYVSGKVYIGAKQLLSQSTEYETLAILAHELCHFVMEIVYGNSANPYKKNDHQTMKEFDKISMACEEANGYEEVVDIVYECYPNEMYHAELIVRVVHLLVLYKNQPEKLTDVRNKFISLFEFYEKKIVPELEKALPEIEEQNEKEILRKDKKISTLKKIAFVFCILSVVGIATGAFLAWYFYEPHYNYDKLSIEDQIRVRKGTVLYKNEIIRLNDVFPDDSFESLNITSEHVSQLLDSKALNFSDPHLYYLDELVTLNWSNLTEKLRHKFLSSNFTFQNESLKFQVLNDLIPNAFLSLTSRQIIDVLDGHNLKIHKMIQNGTDFCVERSFRNENIEFIYNDYMKYINGDFQRTCWFYVNKTRSARTFEEHYWNFTSQNLEIQNKKIDSIKALPQNQYCSLGNFNIRDPDNYTKIIDRLDTNKLNRPGFEEITMEAEKTKIIVLVGEAGMGKTVAFQEFTMRLKRLNPTKWISYIDLKDHKQFYISNVTIESVELLLEEIFSLASKSAFEREIFRDLYMTGNAILLWNGFDEISPQYSDYILEVLSTIKKSTQNIQFINTRPQYSDQLRSYLGSSVYKLIPLDYHKQEEFMRKFFETKKIDGDKIPKFIEKVRKIINSTNSDEGFDTPLLLLMVSGLITDHVEIFESENLYDVYQKFIKSKVDIWYNKSEFGRKFAKERLIDYRDFDIMKLYQRYAITVELSTNPYISLNSPRLSILEQNVPKELTNDEISRMGILYINEPKVFKFAHRSFAEYFVAQFFIENFSNLENIMDIFYFVTKLYGDYQKNITKFLFYYFRSNAVNKPTLSTKKIPERLKKELKDIFFDLEKKDALYYEFLINLFKNDHKFLIKLLHIDENETFYTALYNYNYYSKFGEFHINQSEIKSLVRNLLTENEFEKFIHGKNQKGIIMFSMYCLRRYKNINITHSVYNMSDDVLKSSDIFHVFDSIVANLTQEEIKELFISKTSPIYSFDVKFHVEQEFWNRAEKLLTTEEQRTMLINLIYYYTAWQIGDSQILYEKVFNILTSSDIYEIFSSKKIFHRLITLNTFNDVWPIFVNLTTSDQQKSILKEKSMMKCDRVFDCNMYSPVNILQASIAYDYSYYFDDVIEIYKNYFNKTEIQELISSSKSMLLHFIIRAFDVNCKSFIENLKELYLGSESLLLNFINGSIENTELNVFEYLADFQDSEKCLESFSNLAKSLSN